MPTTYWLHWRVSPKPLVCYSWPVFPVPCVCSNSGALQTSLPTLSNVLASSRCSVQLSRRQKEALWGPSYMPGCQRKALGSHSRPHLIKGANLALTRSGSDKRQTVRTWARMLGVVAPQCETILGRGPPGSGLAGLIAWYGAACGVLCGVACFFPFAAPPPFSLRPRKAHPLLGTGEVVLALLMGTLLCLSTARPIMCRL